MAVKVRQRKTKNGKMYWQADIRVRLPDGAFHRERPKAPGATRAQALRWAQKRELHVIRHGAQRQEVLREEVETEVQESPKFRVFAERFLVEHVEANAFTPSTRRNYEKQLRIHLYPVLGKVRLDEIGPRHVQALKRRGLAATTTNLLLDKLRTILRCAVSWGVLDRVVEIKKVKVGIRQPEFYDFDEYRALIASASRYSPVSHTIVLLGGDAGLRRGEMRALRWSNVYLRREAIYVCENLVERDPVRLPKGGKARWVPITETLMDLLKSLERRGEFVVSLSGGHVADRTIDRYLKMAQLRAGLTVKGPHILRHSFCSHLAMQGTPQKVIQELAGHANSSTTEIYMHLAPRALKAAIRGLRPRLWHNVGTASERVREPQQNQ